MHLGSAFSSSQCCFSFLFYEENISSSDFSWSTLYGHVQRKNSFIVLLDFEC